MERLQRPLDRKAVQQADATLYERHANDPRPNALFDAQGRRRPLGARDPDQADLRSEWRDLYRGSLDSPSPGQKPPSTPEPADDARPVSSPTQPCPKTHWIQIQLVHLEVDPELRRQHRWYSNAKVSKGCASEPFSGHITDGDHEGSLNAAGIVRFDNIPAGSCRIEFPVFFRQIDRYFDEQLTATS